MNRKTTELRALILAVAAAFTLTLATTSFSSSPTQGTGKVSMNDISFVHITGDDIRNLPIGENRLGYVATASGGVWKTTNGGQSLALTKTGTGTLILSSANHSVGVTKVGQGVLQNSAKELTGTLILADSGKLVYEFSNLGPGEFERVFVANGENAGADSTDLRTRVQQSRPRGAMNGWPFRRFVMGPARGIAQFEGWRPELTTKPAASKYTCTTGICACQGAADCLSLAGSGSCSADMNCDGSGNSTRCYCKSI